VSWSVSIFSPLFRVLSLISISHLLSFFLSFSSSSLSSFLLQGTTGEGKSEGVSRETFACFLEPMWDESMAVPEGMDPKEATIGSSTKFLPKGIPELSSRWDNKMDFNEFTIKSLEAYTHYG
jgi:hypothetical protein